MHDEGARALTVALLRAPALKMLYLDTTHTGDADTHALAEALLNAGGARGALPLGQLDARTRPR